MTALVVGECRSCGARRFPQPLWCDACGSDVIDEVAVSSGTVCEATTVHHVAGHRVASVRLGTVKLTRGAVVIARLAPSVEEGSRVDLAVEEDAPVAYAQDG